MFNYLQEFLSFLIEEMRGASILALLLCCIQGNAQDKAKNYLLAYDQFIGIQNTGIFKGTAFVDALNDTDANHKFFKTRQFINGSITIKGETYFEIPLKYNLFSDKVIVQNPENSVLQLLLDPEIVSGFVIDGHQFVKLILEVGKKKEEVSGYFEVLHQYQNKRLYKKHRKKTVNKNTDGFQEIYTFKDSNVYYLSVDGVTYEVKKSIDLATYLPEQSDKIKALSKEKTDLKKNSSAHIEAVANDLFNYLKSDEP